jgi:hypothetical protein
LASPSLMVPSGGETDVKLSFSFTVRFATSDEHDKLVTLIAHTW